MSSPQVRDSSTAAAHLQKFFADNSAEKQANAFADATGKDKAATERTDGRFDCTNAEMQMGRPLTRDEIQKRLIKLNPNLIFERSILYPDRCGIYLRGEGHEKTFVMGMMWDISPQATIDKVERDEDGHKKVIGQTRGWETVVVKLIKKRIIPAERAQDVFEMRRGRESATRHQLLG